MDAHATQVSGGLSADESAVCGLYHELLEAWNKRDASAYAALFVEDGEVVGFDGSLMRGQEEIKVTLEEIFNDHVTAPYVGKIKEGCFLGDGAAFVRAIVGMVPPGQSELNPAVNAHQTLVAVKNDEVWRVRLFQNTPAQYHGRPELVQQMTEELRQVLDGKK